MSDNIIQLNEDLIKHDLRDLVRSSVEETLNALLDHEAEELVNAEKYERSGDRKGYRSGHYNRNFQTTAGDVTLKVPKLWNCQEKCSRINSLNSFSAYAARISSCSIRYTTGGYPPGLDV